MNRRNLLTMILSLPFLFLPKSVKKDVAPMTVPVPAPKWMMPKPSPRTDTRRYDNFVVVPYEVKDLDNKRRDPEVASAAQQVITIGAVTSSFVRVLKLKEVGFLAVLANRPDEGEISRTFLRAMVGEEPILVAKKVDQFNPPKLPWENGVRVFCRDAKDPFYWVEVEDWPKPVAGVLSKGRREIEAGGFYAVHSGGKDYAAFKFKD